MRLVYSCVWNVEMGALAARIDWIRFGSIRFGSLEADNDAASARIVPPMGQLC